MLLQNQPNQKLVLTTKLHILKMIGAEIAYFSRTLIFLLFFSLLIDFIDLSPKKLSQNLEELNNIQFCSSHLNFMDNEATFDSTYKTATTRN